MLIGVGTGILQDAVITTDTNPDNVVCLCVCVYAEISLERNKGVEACYTTISTTAVQFKAIKEFLVPCGAAESIFTSKNM